jgi:hypothetical protein
MNLHMAFRGAANDRELFYMTFEQGTPPRRPVDGGWVTTRLGDRASFEGPALASFQDKLVMAWRGNDDGDISDRTIWWAHLNINDPRQLWSAQRQLTDRASVTGPALASFNGKLYMAWRGPVGDQEIWMASWDGDLNHNWSPQILVPKIGSAFGPTLAAFDDKLYMAWRGVNNDQQLFWCSFHATPPLLPGFDLGFADPPSPPLPDRGSADGPNLVVFQSRLTMIWRGVDGLDELDFGLWHAVLQPGAEWSGQSKILDANTRQVGSLRRPGATVYADRIFLALVGDRNFGLPSLGSASGNDHPDHPGVDPDHSLFITGFDGFVADIPEGFSDGSVAPVAVLAAETVAPQSGNFIQGTWGQRGNFELLVPQGDHVAHFFRNNDDPTLPWHRIPDLPTATNSPGGPFPVTFTDLPLGLSLVQSNFKGDGIRGNFEAIVRLHPMPEGNLDYLAFYFLESNVRQWEGPFPIIADGQPIDGVTGAPALIQGTWGQQGNFELLVPQGDHVAHFFRNNDDPTLPWHRIPDLPTATNRPGGPFPVTFTDLPLGVSLIQSNFKGDGIRGNFEAIVRLHPMPEGDPDYLAFYFLESNVRKWKGPFPIIADGQPIEGVTGAPALIQSTWGQRGNFELLVPQGDHVAHFFRNNDDPTLPWHRIPDLPTATNRPGGPFPLTFTDLPLGVSLIQSNFKGDGIRGNFEAIVRLHPMPEGDPDYLAFYFLESNVRQWKGPLPIIADGQPIAGITGW